MSSGEGRSRKSGLLTKLMAILSVVCMVILSFQVICAPASAQDVGASASDNSSMEANYQGNSLTEPSVYTNEAPGTITSYSSPLNISVSDLGSGSTAPYFTENSTDSFLLDHQWYLYLQHSDAISGIP